MKHCFFTLSLFFAAIATLTSQVVYEIYGGGGNAGAPYLNDAIVLQGTAGASLVGSSVQYAAATGTTWTVITLTGSFNANGFYKIQLGSGGAVGVALPFAPNQTNGLNISATAGKVALVSTTTALSGSCPTGTSILDFVGYGATASCSETSPAPAGSNTTSIKRTNGDSNNNSTDFTVNSTPLPIVLAAFSAKANYNLAVLSFTTVSEHNNAYFSIERSQDGVRFEPIGRVAGAGNSSVQRDYTFTDNSPVKGVNFYRLQQVDTDGKFAYSPVVSVTVGELSGIRLSPLPVLDQLKVALDEPSAAATSWLVYDFSGRLLQSGVLPEESTDFEIDTATFAEGSYVLRLVNGQQVTTQQFQKR